MNDECIQVNLISFFYKKNNKFITKKGKGNGKGTS